jgi:hypothetical protein
MEIATAQADGPEGIRGPTPRVGNWLNLMTERALWPYRQPQNLQRLGRYLMAVQHSAARLGAAIRDSLGPVFPPNSLESNVLRECVVAERVGFEPTEPLRVLRISSAVH